MEELRLVPGLDPKDVLEKIKQLQLKKKMAMIRSVVYTLGGMSYRSDSAPSILNVHSAGKAFYEGDFCSSNNSTRTGPILWYLKSFRVPLAAFKVAMPIAVIMGATNGIADYYTAYWSDKRVNNEEVMSKSNDSGWNPQ